MQNLEQIRDHMQYLQMIKDVFNLGTKATEAVDFAIDQLYVLHESIYHSQQIEENDKMFEKAKKRKEKLPYGAVSKKQIPVKRNLAKARTYKPGL